MKPGHSTPAHSNRLIDPERIKNQALRDAVIAFCKSSGSTSVMLGKDVDHQYPWRSKGAMVTVHANNSSKEFYLKDYQS